MHEEFKASLQPGWSVDDNGITFKRDYYVWAEVNSISIFHTPKSSLTNGVFVAQLRGKRKNLAYSYRDRERAQTAYDFIQSKINGGTSKTAPLRKMTGSREELLSKNSGVPFSTQIEDNCEDQSLAYNYTRVACTLTGDTDGLQEGAVLLPQRDGVLMNVAREPVAQIDNKKLRDMVTDFFDKDRFCTLEIKFVSIEEDKMFINMGFFIDNDPYDDDDEDDDDYDEDD